ncbi:ArsR/SmtB family transcription factor [Roseibium algae]|uniref:Metalloregulator ArsR/SmtB family transcription factor n=1 Tax=Roseibium algae TaxID=3123038 RepID=A0ABU8TPG5_9HYPH
MEDEGCGDSSGGAVLACDDVSLTALVAGEREGLARIFRALGHPARLAIIEALAQRPGACCGDIVNTLPLAQSTVSQHLQVLKETGLLTCSTRGRCCHYDLNLDMLQKAGVASGEFFARIEDQCSKCAVDIAPGKPDASSGARPDLQIEIQNNGAHHANEGGKPHGDLV